MSTALHWNKHGEMKNVWHIWHIKDTNPVHINMPTVLYCGWILSVWVKLPYLGHPLLWAVQSYAPDHFDRSWHKPYQWKHLSLMRGAWSLMQKKKKVFYGLGSNRCSHTTNPILRSLQMQCQSVGFLKSVQGKFSCKMCYHRYRMWNTM